MDVGYLLSVHVHCSHTCYVDTVVWWNCFKTTQDSLLTLTEAQQTLCVHITPSPYKGTYLLYIYAFLCIILYTCLKVCPVGSSNILLNIPVNVYFLLCFKYLLMFLNSYKLDFFFSFAKHTHLQNYLALTLKMECQLWSILARLVIHKFFLLFCTSVSAPIYFVSEKEV